MAARVQTFSLSSTYILHKDTNMPYKTTGSIHKLFYDEKKIPIFN